MPVTMTEHPAKDLIEEMWRSGKRAKEIIEWLNTTDWPQVKYSTLARYGQRNWSEKTAAIQTVESVEVATLNVDELVEEVERSGGQILKVSVSKKPRLEWDKSSGENVQVSRDVVESRVEFIPVRKDSILQRAELPNISIIPSEPLQGPSKPRKMKLAVSIPDMQIGAYDGSEGALEPTQDERAINVALQIITYMHAQHGVDLIVNQGDNLDFPAFSSHRTPPAYITNKATQYAIDRYSTILATQRAIAPKATIVDLPSNHVIRLVNTLIDKIPALVGITRADSKTPILSVAHLCRFEDHKVIQPPGGYPDGKYWASDNLLFVHGDKTSSVPGATARKYLREGVSVVYGHHHHEELLRNVVEVNGRSRVSFAGSAGCLCQVNGSLPSSRTGSDDTGKLAGVQREVWNQGIWFIWYDPKGQQDPVLEICQIEDGQSIFRGQKFQTTVDMYGNPV